MILMKLKNKIKSMYNINKDEIKNLKGQELVNAYDRYIKREINFAFKVTRIIWFIAFIVALITQNISLSRFISTICISYIIMLPTIVRLKRYTKNQEKTRIEMKIMDVMKDA